MDGTEPSQDLMKGEASWPPPFLCISGANGSITSAALIAFLAAPLFKDYESNYKGNCYDRNDQKQNCQPMLPASFA